MFWNLSCMLSVSEWVTADAKDIGGFIDPHITLTNLNTPSVVCLQISSLLQFRNLTKLVH